MIKVLLVDDSAIVRKAIKTILNRHPEIQVIGECKDGEEVIPFLQHQKPDVILMDSNMPVLNGIEATKLVNHLFPEIKVIGLSCHDDIVTKNAFFENGAVGFLSKYETTNEKLVLKINNCCLIM
ncbi:MAG: hypothetical protein CMD31_12905 [Flavobacteriales bacterium]|nr:hypothetical protein [Flavobacteriales bacterium]|tara:strand:+ start:24520 stop:24891 length:372 start_codon:yes stop_codon:yes gene_type:complete